MADLPILNVPLLEQCLKWAEFSAGTEGNPAWYQGAWTTTMLPSDEDRALDAERRKGKATFEDNYCGTAFCMSGYALSVTDNLMSRQYRSPFVGKVDTFEPKMEIVNERGECLLAGGSDWSAAGGHVLGLTQVEAYAFFDGENTLELLKSYAAAFAERRGVPIHIEGRVEPLHRARREGIE